MSAFWKRDRSKWLARATERFDALSKNSEEQLALLQRIESATKALDAKMRDLDRRLSLHDHFSLGANSTYLGKGRVLAECAVDNQRFAFLVEAYDLLSAPQFIASGHYETRLTDFFLREVKTDSHCIDVGANFGYFTCLFGRRASSGKVIGIEPDKRIYELVRDNIHINGLSGVASAKHAAASSALSQIKMHRRANRSGNAGSPPPDEDFLRQLGEPRSEAFSVTAIPLDVLMDPLKDKVDFIRIEAEEANPLVLAGAKEIIKSNPQITIVMEWSPNQIRGAGHDCAGFLRHIRAQGLSIFEIETGEPLSDDALLGLDYSEGIVFRRTA